MNQINTDIETARNFLENQMINLSPELSQREGRIFLSGCIETMFAAHAIDAGSRDILLGEYAL